MVFAPAPSPSPVVPQVIVNVTPPPAVVTVVDKGPEFIDYLNGIGAFSAAMIALVALGVALWQLRRQRQQFEKQLVEERERADRQLLDERERFEEQIRTDQQRLIDAQIANEVERCRSLELGLLRELLDSIPSHAEDQREAQANEAVEVITDRHFQVLSLLPNDVLPMFRRLAVAVGRGHGEVRVAQICDEASSPQTFGLRDRVRRIQRRELIEAIKIRSGSNPTEVAEWLDALDGLREM